MSPVELLLLRHGEPELAGRLLGRSDVPSTARGVRDCVGVAAGLAFGRVVASPLLRARAAGEAIAAERCVPFDPDARWRELDFGDWDGRSVAEIAVAEAAALARFWEDAGAHPPPGGERWPDLLDRVRAGLAAIVGHAPGPPTLVVTHGGAMRGALAVLCGFGQAQLWAFDLPYAALLHLRVHGGTDGMSGQILRLDRP